MNTNAVVRWGAVAFVVWMVYRAAKVIAGINTTPRYPIGVQPGAAYTPAPPAE